MKISQQKDVRTGSNSWSHFLEMKAHCYWVGHQKLVLSKDSKAQRWTGFVKSLSQRPMHTGARNQNTRGVDADFWLRGHGFSVRWDSRNIQSQGSHLRMWIWRRRRRRGDSCRQAHSTRASRKPSALRLVARSPRHLQYRAALQVHIEFTCKYRTDREWPLCNSAFSIRHPGIDMMSKAGALGQYSYLSRRKRVRVRECGVTVSLCRVQEKGGFAEMPVGDFYP